MNVYGSDNSETINALDGVTNGADTIFGYGGDDTIYGLGGNDQIKGGGGADAINGGSGTDTANYSDSAAGVVVSLISNTGSGGTAQGDTLTSIENLTGSAHEDFLIGNDGNNVLTGLEDDDILKGGGGADTLYGDSGNDTLKGGGGADILNGGSGIDEADYFDSSEGVFVSLITDSAAWGDAEGDEELNSIENLSGSAYDDHLWGNDGVNVLIGRDGEDSLKGWGGNDTLIGGDDNDSLYGMDGADTLRGENGNDMLDGGAGDDTMIGGTGDDSYYVDSSSDVVTEAAGQGTDVVFSNAYSYELAANVENLSLDSGDGSAVYGTGNDLDNLIFGNAGSNTLNGGAGADQINGLGGEDTFVFHAGQANGDVVHGFEGNGLGAGDVIYFVGYGTVAEGATFHQLDATHWEISSADGTIHDIITLAGAPTVDATDFSFY